MKNKKKEKKSSNSLALERLRKVPLLDGKEPRFLWNENVVMLSDLEVSKKKGDQY